jgi:hypothetical protein
VALAVAGLTGASGWFTQADSPHLCFQRIEGEGMETRQCWHMCARLRVHWQARRVILHVTVPSVPEGATGSGLDSSGDDATALATVALLDVAKVMVAISMTGTAIKTVDVVPATLSWVAGLSDKRGRAVTLEVPPDTSGGLPLLVTSANEVARFFALRHFVAMKVPKDVFSAQSAQAVEWLRWEERELSCIVRAAVATQSLSVSNQRALIDKLGLAVSDSKFLSSTVCTLDPTQRRLLSAILRGTVGRWQVLSRCVGQCVLCLPPRVSRCVCRTLLG